MFSISLCIVEISLYSWIGMSMTVHADDSMSDGVLTPLTATMWYSMGSFTSYIVLMAITTALPPIECQRDLPTHGENIGPPSLTYAARNGVGVLLTLASLFLYFLLIKTGGIFVAQTSWTVLPVAYIISSKILWAISWAYEKKLGFFMDGIATICLVGLWITHPQGCWVSILWITAKSQSILFDDKTRIVHGDDPSLTMFWNSAGAFVISWLIAVQMTPNENDVKDMVIPVLVMFLIGFAKGALFLVFDARRLKTNSDAVNCASKSNFRMGLTGLVFHVRCFGAIAPIDGVFFWCSFIASVGNRILRKRDAMGGEEDEEG